MVAGGCHQQTGCVFYHRGVVCFPTEVLCVFPQRCYLLCNFQIGVLCVMLFFIGVLCVMLFSHWGVVCYAVFP